MDTIMAADTPTDTTTTIERVGPVAGLPLLLFACALGLWESSGAIVHAAEPQPKVVVNSIGMKLVPIAAGTFHMGSPNTQPGRQERETRHKVTISQPFYIGAYEVTQAEYAAVMKTQPSHFGRDVEKAGELPVERVSWDDAVAFCEKLSALPAEREAKRRYRLPTEAQWEYACRAGGEGIWCFGDELKTLTDYAWFGGKGSLRATQPVGRKKPNAWGLYDMHGNVWEWCSDWYQEELSEHPATDPQGPREGETRVIRGGCYQSLPAYTRCATRFHDPPQVKDEDLGFRVLMIAE